MPRDNQRQRVYNAEREVHGFRPAQGVGKFTVPTATVPEMQRYITKLVNSAWFKKTFKRSRTVIVKPGKGHRRATCETTWEGVILQMPRWARSEMILLHELAHACARWGDAPHGRTFCWAYIALVEHQLGKEKAEELRAAFRRHNVDWGGTTV